MWVRDDVLNYLDDFGTALSSVRTMNFVAHWFRIFLKVINECS